MIRAEWINATDRSEEALLDLMTVAASVRNFDGIETRARALIAQIEGPATKAE